MSDCPTQNRFGALMDGDLGADEAAEIHQHADGCESCRQLLTELARSAVEAHKHEASGRAFSEYRLEDRVGEGGMGVIYRASDVELGRTVALKLQRGARNDPATPDPSVKTGPSSPIEARFLREALITARLQHPSIVPVYQAGRWPTGEIFYTMKLISGSSLQKLIAETQTLADRVALLPHVLAASDAVAYAHFERVIHRDLKPSNIMVGPFGETLVIDWGLAKDLAGKTPSDAQDTPERGAGTEPTTMKGVVVGTPAYMPPEQALGREVDERADVYALGAVLYHLFAQSAPFDGAEPAKVLAQVAKAAPPPIETREPNLPPDLATLIHKAMARDASDRYATAKELSDDLRRFQTGQLVGAHAYSWLALLRRRLARQRVAVTTAGVLLLALVAMAIVGVGRIVRERNTAAARTNELTLLEAQHALTTDPTAAVAWLKTYPRDGADWGLTRTIALDALGRGVARHVIPYVRFQTLTQDGRFAVGGGSDHLLHVWDLETGRSIATTPLPSREASYKPILSSDDKMLAFLRWGSPLLWIWDIDHRTLRTVEAGQGTLFDIAFLPDGHKLVSAGGDGTVRTWDLGTGGSRIFAHQARPVKTVAVSPDGKVLATQDADGSVRLWDLATGQGRDLGQAQAMTDGLRFSPDGRLLVPVQPAGPVVVFELATGQRRELATPDRRVPAVTAAFAPDSKHYATGEMDGTVRLWDLTNSSTPPRVLTGHRTTIFDVDFSRDGRLLASAGSDSTTRLWDVSTAQQTAVFPCAGGCGELAFTVNDRNLLVASAAGLHVWDIRPDDARVLRGHDGKVYDAVFSADGRLLATASSDRTVRLWNSRTGESKLLRGHADAVYRAAFSPDGHTLASSGFDRTVRLWNVASGESRVLAGHEDTVWEIAFSPDGSKLASSSQDGTVRLWDTATGEGRILGDHGAPVHPIAFSPDGRQFASGGEDNAVRLRNLDGGESRVVMQFRQLVIRLAFSPDGRRLAAASYDGSIQLLDVASGKAGVLGSHTRPVKVMLFSADGKTIISGGDDGIVQLWDIDGRSHRSLVAHTGQPTDLQPIEILGLAASPDGRLLAVADADGTVRLWDLPTGLCLSIRHYESRVLALSISPDGEFIASGDSVGTVRLLPVKSRTTLPVSIDGLHEWLQNATTATVMPDHRVQTP